MKNEVTSVTEPNYITVKASEGLNYEVLDFIDKDFDTAKSIHDSLENEFFGYSSAFVNQAPNKVQDITISVCFSLDEDSLSGFSNFDTGFSCYRRRERFQVYLYMVDHHIQVVTCCAC